MFRHAAPRPAGGVAFVTRRVSLLYITCCVGHSIPLPPTPRQAHPAERSQPIVQRITAPLRF